MKKIHLILQVLLLTQVIPAFSQSRSSEINKYLFKNKKYHQVTTATPDLIVSDIDGDGKKDQVIIVKNDKGEQGLLFFLSKTQKIIVIGAGVEFNEWTDLNFTTWHVHLRKKKIQVGVEAGRPPRLHGNALLLEWDEAGSGLVYWDGNKIQWYQQGD